MLVDAHTDAIRADLERRKEGRTLIEEGQELSKHLFPFIRQAWHVLRPDDQFVDNWHIHAICEHLEYISNGDIDRLFIWVPPGYMKTLSVDVCWPVWEWTRNPSLRTLACTYDMEMQIELGMIPSRDLILSEWFEARWGHIVNLKESRRAAYTNTRGGARWAAAPNAKKITGRHAHRIILDDPNDANSTEGEADSDMQRVNDWHDGALGTRLLAGGAKVIIQQRLHENDLSGHLLEREEDRWVKLCIPEEYMPSHQFAWPDDPRKTEGELAWPELFGPARHAERVSTMGLRRASGQLQQEPAAREGEIIKRAYWRYYEPEHLEMLEAGELDQLPGDHPFRRIHMCVPSWDTSFKDKISSDPVAGGIWAVADGNRYLLKTRHERMGLAATKTAMLEQRSWGMARFQFATHRLLIEKKSNGVEIISQLRHEIPGVTVYNPGNLDKTQRAMNAEPDFESGNVFICGRANAAGTDYDPAFTPAWAQEVIEQCAKFPKGRHDDLVDQTTQFLNWARGRSTKPATLYEPADITLPAPYGIPAGSGSILGA